MPLSGSEKMRTYRKRIAQRDQDQRTYLAALERALQEAADRITNYSTWHTHHAATIARARAAQTEKES